MLYCNTPTQEVGMFKQGSIPVFYYEIENKGDKQLTLKPWANCGCSTPILEKETVAPGERFCLKLAFDTMGKIGKNQKSFGLFYGDKEKLTLTFIANVVE